MSELHLCATFTAQPGQEQRVAEAIAEYEQTVRGEYGTVEFRAYTLKDSPQSFHVHEIYVDDAAFRAHVTSVLADRFNDVLPDFIVEPSSVVTFLTPVSEATGPAWRTTENSIVDKPWGREEIFAGDLEPYVGKIITLLDGNAVSLQLHSRKTETLTVLSGALAAEVGESAHTLDAFQLEPGRALYVRAGIVHRFTAVGDTTFVEVSTAEPGWETDVVRLHDQFGRSGTTAQ